MKPPQNDSEYDIVITSLHHWYDIKIRETFRYRNLIALFVKRNIITQYKQTVLGPIWFIINPLLSSFISTIVFGRIAGIQSDGIPYFLFYLTGYTIWNYFSTCVSNTSSTFTANAGIMGKVYFPRLTVPIASVIYAAVNMLIVFVLSLITMCVYSFMGVSIHISAYVLLIPVFMIQTAVLGLGVGIIISALTTKYRDLVILVSFGLNLWMYITPVVYPISEVPGKLRTAILFNPMSSVIQNYKYVLLGVGEFVFLPWIYSLAVTIIIFFIGVILFNRVEKTFMDTV